MVNFPVVGRLGDLTTFKSLPSELINDEIARAFEVETAAVTETGAVMVCGSPFEVATVHNADRGPKNLTDTNLFGRIGNIWLVLDLPPYFF